jgi:hypothetical protein
MVRKFAQLWKPPMQRDDRALIWVFVIASAGICLTEMFLGR